MEEHFTPIAVIIGLLSFLTGLYGQYCMNLTQRKKKKINDSIVQNLI